MTVEMEKDGDTDRVRIVGELTVYQAAAQRHELLGVLDRCGNAAFDLARVTEMDTAGLQLLLAFRREAGKHNKTVHIVAAAPAVQELLRLTNVAECFGLPHRAAAPASAG